MSETPLVLDQIPIRGSVIKSIAIRRVPVAGNPALYERPQMADELLLTAQSDGAEHAQILTSEAIDGGFVLRITPPIGSIVNTSVSFKHRQGCVIRIQPEHPRRNQP